MMASSTPDAARRDAEILERMEQIRAEQEATLTPEFLALVEFTRPLAIHALLCSRGYAVTTENTPDASTSRLGRFQTVSLDPPGPDCICGQEPHVLRRGEAAKARLAELYQSGQHLIANRPESTS